MIARDSILRRLPANLDPKQRLFLDGIRHAAEIAAFAYRRLRHTLTQIATEQHSESNADDLYTSAFLDAWSLVDVIDRFRSLWSSLPHISHSPPKNEARSFAELSGPVRDLRNVADHLAQRADYIVARKGSALGVLSWFTALRPGGLEGVSCMIVPGTLQRASNQAVNPVGRAIELPTDLIHLSAGEYRACLSDVLPEMALRVRELEVVLEKGLRELGAEHSQAGADLLVKMTIALRPESEKQSDSEGEPRPFNGTDP